MLQPVRQFFVRREDVMRRAFVFCTLALLVAVMVAPNFIAAAQEPTLQLNIDPSPLFASISAYVPLFFGILAVAGGILIGKRIAEFVIKAIADAF